MPGNVCYIPLTPGSGENGCFCCFATGRRVENKQTGCLRRNLRLAARIKYRITRLYHIKAGLAHKADCLFVCQPCKSMPLLSGAAGSPFYIAET